MDDAFEAPRRRRSRADAPGRLLSPFPRVPSDDGLKDDDSFLASAIDQCIALAFSDFSDSREVSAAVSHLTELILTAEFEVSDGLFPTEFQDLLQLILISDDRFLLTAALPLLESLLMRVPHFHDIFCQEPFLELFMRYPDFLIRLLFNNRICVLYFEKLCGFFFETKDPHFPEFAVNCLEQDKKCQMLNSEEVFEVLRVCLENQDWIEWSLRISIILLEFHSGNFCDFVLSENLLFLDHLENSHFSIKILVLRFLKILVEMDFPLQTADIQHICQRLQWQSQVKDLLLLAWQLSDLLALKFPAIADYLADAGILDEAISCFEGDNPIHVKVAAAMTAFHVVARLTGDRDAEQVEEIREMVEELRESELVNLDA
jgi:hypothetical protein